MVAILIAARPGAIPRIIQITDHFFQDTLARLSGPGRVRFIFQPAAAVILGMWSGMTNASAGPFLWGLVLQRELGENCCDAHLGSITGIEQADVSVEKSPESGGPLGLTAAEKQFMRYLNRRLFVVVISLLAVMSASGKSSKLVTSWKNPAYLAGRRFHRVLVLGLSDQTVIRADFEDALAAQITKIGIETIPGNTILLRPEGTQFDLKYLKTQIRENGIDAVVVSRLIKVENTATYVPGAPYVPPYPYYSSFYGYYGAVYPVVYNPGYLKKEKKVRIETNLYAISSEEGELAWTCITDTFNPSNAKKAIDRLVTLVTQQMQSEGLL